MRRYYALLLANGSKVRLVKALDGVRTLAEIDFPWEIGQSYTLRLQANGNQLRAWIDGQLLFEVEDNDQPLAGGAAAFILEEGHMMSDSLAVRPLTGTRFPDNRIAAILANRAPDGCYCI